MDNMSECRIIPRPENISFFNGTFIFNSQTVIYVTEREKELGKYFQKLISNSTGWDLTISKNLIKNNALILNVNRNLEHIGKEGYKCEIAPDAIKISSFTRNGVFYGLQTLRQLLPAEIEGSNNFKSTKLAIKCMKIVDKPRFQYRGFMLDVGRHYQSVELIKRILDLMSLLKLNKFHWHLTEDQGWRIEIKKYPKLTQIGSKRKNTKIGGWLSKNFRNIPHDGFYSHDEIKEIVKFARERFITVIPEIEMPGHSRALLASYPEFGCECLENPVEVATTFGIKNEILCAGKEQTYKFLEGILDEVTDLFPSEIIHIGGDEAPKKNWKKCSDCQAKIKTEKLKNEHELQVYFTNRIASYLKSKGRRIMGWNEILDDKLNSNTVAQWWFRGKRNIIKHIKKGGDVVVSKIGSVYLDYNYIFTPLKKTYEFEPIPSELEPSHHKQILGVEAPLWTEWVPNVDRFDWQVFPRLIALSEVAWTKKELKNYANFKDRLKIFLKRLDCKGFHYAPLNQVDPGRIKQILRSKSVLKWPEI